MQHLQDLKQLMHKQELPDWVNFIAQDADGCWWAYEVEPNQHDRGWYENEIGQSRRLGITVPNQNWRQALYKRDEVVCR